MECPKCRFDNPDGMKFCGECGVRLETICPECNFSNPPQFKFCGECGHNLAISEPFPRELSFIQKLDKIQKYLPKGLSEKILSQKDKIEGERKQVTVMFCDMEGFTALTEKLGSEEAYTIMDQVYEILIHRVRNYEGTVNEMTGDGIMALFGAPIALEDAPQRALRSALSIHREVSILSERLASERNAPPIRMRIGIHTGSVVVGALGNDLRVEFKAVGDTVNLASRMEGLADPGTTYVTEETFNLTSGFFRFEAMGAKQIKGKKTPVRAYRVIAPSSRRTRFDVSAERGLTPLVGRERELELLLDGFERAKGGRGQAITIMGEAGLGKSRLLYEFRKALGGENVTFLEGRCLSYGRGAVFHPVIDILKSNFAISDSDDERLIRSKVKKGLKELGADEAATLPYTLELLSVKNSGIDQISMSPEARKDRIMEALKRIVMKGSEIRPLIMAFEDLHWMDRSTEEVLKHITESISGARVMLIFTHRPEFVPKWGSRSYHSQVTLNRLSNRESLAMVAHILGTDEIDRDLEELILEKSEGIPFFIEEFVGSLSGLAIIEKRGDRFFLAKDIRKMSVPSTIQDVIMAKVDSLPPGAKEVLQTGSAIEREFSHGLIKRMADITEQELLSHLSLLRDSELLFERGIYPQSTYVFKHALTREVVYDSILTKRRKILHARIGDAIEGMYKDNLREHWEALAEHYTVGERYEKAAEYCRLAERKAEKTASLNDAITYSEKRAANLERLPQTKDVQKKIVDARTALGLYCMQMNHHQEAKEAVKPIVDLALALGYNRRISQIYTIMGSHSAIVEEDFPKALEHLGDALKIAEELDDTLSLVFAHFWYGFVLSLNFEFQRGIRHLEKDMEINAAVDALWGVSIAKSTMCVLVYSPQGRIDQGYRTSGEALQIAEKSGDIFSKGLSYAIHGIFCYYRGLLEQSETYLTTGIDLCESIRYPFGSSVGLTYLGNVYFDMGEYRKSQSCYQKAILLLDLHRLLPSWCALNKIALARAKTLSDEATTIDVEEIFRCYESNRYKAFDGRMARYIGEFLLGTGGRSLSEAEHWIKKAIDADRGSGMMFQLAEDLISYAELCKRKGKKPEEKERLIKALEIFRECGADGRVKKVEEMLKAVSKNR